MTPRKRHIIPDLCNRRFPFHYVTALNLLMKLGVDINQVDIITVGEYENYKGEVREQQPSPGTPIDSGTKITLKVGSSSAVDRMPYQFFYGLTGIRSSTGAWEDRSREFMAPFDAALIREQANSSYQTRKYDFGILESEHLERVLKLFGFEPSDYLKDFRELLFWASVFPTFHYWSGSPVLVEKILGYIFGFSFKIVENVESEYEIPEPLRYRLGSKTGRLSHESIIGRSFIERDSGYSMIVNGVRPDQVEDLLPGMPGRNKLEWVLRFCMPNNLDCHIIINVNKGRTGIGRDKRKCYLGYSSYV
ncbi:MAG: type VI secretion system baseplate subunit TssG [Candidatus Zixiibacteriota bacterium]|nr:MAG: type VI secretion system baseplate subunit TssG [candidate division Zixibacteria bacterium]